MKFWTANIVGLALLVAAWWVGALELIVGADRVHAIPVLGVVFAAALVFGLSGRWSTVEFIADKMPVLGLIGTVLGVIWAIHDVQGADIDAMRVQVFTEVGQALVSNLLGIAGYAWLAVLSRVCAP